MEKFFDLPEGVQFIYNSDDSTLRLSSLFGMTCGHNGTDYDYSSAGVAVLCVDDMRLEGAKLAYTLPEWDGKTFSFSAGDHGRTIRLDVVWEYDPSSGVYSCCYSLHNISGSQKTLRRALARFVFSPGSYEVVSQTSAWCAENQVHFQTLSGSGIHLRGRDARSSVGNTPFCILQDQESRHSAAFHVLPRGNWVINIDQDIIQNESPRPVLEMGLADRDLFMGISPGEKIELPEILLHRVPQDFPGFAGVPVQKYITKRRLPEELHTPQVVYNSWLYRFTNFDEEQLLCQLDAAASIGCEVFIVDAGWFGGPDWWNHVGNWQEREGKPFYGNMASFADKVRAQGLKFGFWMEPERWVENVPARKAHPEWFPEHSTRIDLTNDEAAEFFYNTIAESVRKFGAEYIKIDFNASIGYDNLGCEHYIYCSRLRELINRLHREFPALAIENCGSGALRCDLDTALIYDHAFVSDNAHPWGGLKIRQGTYMRLLPGRTLNWVVTRPAPERYTPLSGKPQVLACTAASWEECAVFEADFVLNSAMTGIPGFTGDLAALDPEILKMYAERVRFYKENRDFFTGSHLYSLTPVGGKLTGDDSYIVFQMQSCGNSDSLVFVFSNASSRRAVRRFRLQGLDRDRSYKVEKLFTADPESVIVSGAELTDYGLCTKLAESMHIRYASAVYRVREA